MFEEQASSPQTDFRGNGESILIVDDVAVQREVATLEFSQLGYDVRAVASGEEAVKQFNERQGGMGNKSYLGPLFALKLPARPVSPAAKRNMVVGSGTGVKVLIKLSLPSLV